MLTRAAQIALGIAAVPLRLAATAGSVLFGTKNFVDYVTHKNLHPEHKNISFSYQIASVIIAVLMVSITRIPALFRSSQSQKEKPEEILEAALEEIVIDAPKQQALHLQNSALDMVLDQAAQSESVSCGRESLAVALKVLLRLSVIINGIGVALGAYNSGRSLCNFVTDHAHLHANEENKDKEYYIVLALTLCIAASNVLTYIAYVSSAANKNIDSLIESIRKNKSFEIHPCTVFGATVAASFNVATSTTFNLLSALSGMNVIEKDIVNFPFNTAHKDFKFEKWAMGIAGLTALTVIPTEGLTTVSQLARDFDAILKDASKNKQTNNGVKQHPCVSIFKPPALILAGLDAFNTSLQGFASIALTAHALMGWNQYGYIVNFAFLCALSKMLTQFSFYGKMGIDDFGNDLNHCFKFFDKSKNTEMPDEKGGEYQLINELEALDIDNAIELKEMKHEIIDVDDNIELQEMEYEVLDIDNFEVLNNEAGTIELEEMESIIIESDESQNDAGYYKPFRFAIR